MARTLCRYPKAEPWHLLQHQLSCLWDQLEGPSSEATAAPASPRPLHPAWHFPNLPGGWLLRSATAGTSTDARLSEALPSPYKPLPCGQLPVLFWLLTCSLSLFKSPWILQQFKSTFSVQDNGSEASWGMGGIAVSMDCLFVRWEHISESQGYVMKSRTWKCRAGLCKWDALVQRVSSSIIQSHVLTPEVHS